MDSPYHCADKTYIAKSIQVQDQDQSSKDESGMVAMRRNQGMRVGFPREGLLMSVGRQQAFRINTDGLWKRTANKSEELCDREVKDYDEESFKKQAKEFGLDSVGILPLL